MSWHMNEKVMVGVIIAVAINTVTSIGQAVYVLKTLDTDPPIAERVRVLELKASDFGKTMSEVRDILKSLKLTIDAVHREQARRQPLVDYVEKRMNK